MTKYHRYELINTEELQKDLEVRKLMIEKQLIKLISSKEAFVRFLQS